MNFDSFRNTLSPYSVKSIVFVGLGNPMRADDGAGLVLLQKLKQSRSFQSARFIEAGVNPENYLQTILDFNPQAVVFIDAARCGRPPGAIEWLTGESLDRIRISTHAFSMTLVETYLSSHKKLDFHYLGIQPESTAPGTRLAASVQEGIDGFIPKSETPDASF